MVMARVGEGPRGYAWRRDGWMHTLATAGSGGSRECGRSTMLAVDERALARRGEVRREAMG